MTKECFDELCDDIIENVGEEEFKSEEFIHAKLHVERDELPFITSKKRKMFFAHSTSSGGLHFRIHFHENE